MKIAGTGTTLIAKALNDRGIPCPSELYRSRGDTRQWKNKGRKCYWTACKVENIIRDEKYTGTMVQLKTKLDAVGGKQVICPKEECVRVENTHEPIITYPQYIRAVSSLKQQKAKESKKRRISIIVGAVAGHCSMPTTEPSSANSGHSRLVLIAVTLRLTSMKRIWRCLRPSEKRQRYSLTVISCQEAGHKEKFPFIRQ